MIERMTVLRTIRSELDSNLELISLLFLLFGFATDLWQHIAEREDFTTFLFGAEGVFAPHHVLIPLGSLVLFLVVVWKAYHFRKLTNRSEAG